MLLLMMIIDDDDKYDNNNKFLTDNSFVPTFEKKIKFCSIEKHFAHSECNSKSKYRVW